MARVFPHLRRDGPHTNVNPRFGRLPGKDRTGLAADSDATVVNPRLVNLLASFIRGSSDYTLARLEFTMRFEDYTAPPVLARLPDASQETLAKRWDVVESQLANILGYVKQLELTCSSEERADPAFRRLRRTTRELDQYARALRWVLTVNGGDTAP